MDTCRMFILKHTDSKRYISTFVPIKLIYIFFLLLVTHLIIHFIYLVLFMGLRSRGEVPVFSYSLIPLCRYSSLVS